MCKRVDRTGPGAVLCERRCLLRPRKSQDWPQPPGACPQATDPSQGLWKEDLLPSKAVPGTERQDFPLEGLPTRARIGFFFTQFLSHWSEHLP